MTTGVCVRMECPKCGSDRNKVIDSRPKERFLIWRRRQCLSCNTRFTTFEATEANLPRVYLKRESGRNSSLKEMKALASFLTSTLEVLTTQVNDMIADLTERETARLNGDGGTDGTVGRTGGRTKSGRRPGSTDTDHVVKIIRRHKNGIDIPTLIQRTGFSDKKIRNIVYRASKEGLIKKIRRGVYGA